MKITKRQLQEIISESVKKTLMESGDTLRGSYMKGRALGRRLAHPDFFNGNNSLEPKDYIEGNASPQKTGMGIDDQYGYEHFAGKKDYDSELQAKWALSDIKDHYNQAKFFDDWSKYIDKKQIEQEKRNSKRDESKLRKIVSESMRKVLREEKEKPSLSDFYNIIKRNSWYEMYDGLIKKDGKIFGYKYYILPRFCSYMGVEPSDFDIVKKELEDVFGELVVIKTIKNSRQPEIAIYTVKILLSEPTPIAESINRVLNEVGDPKMGEPYFSDGFMASKYPSRPHHKKRVGN